MEIGKTLYLTDRIEWRKWLERNFEKENEIWLIYPNKASGKPRIIYNDAVEEALCFGWIDSTVKKYEADSAAQRFSPRNPKSPYSQPNKERLKWLANENMLHPSVEGQVVDIINEVFVFPDDILNEIKKDKAAWVNYQKYSEPYRRIRIAWIDSARIRPEEFEKRLNYFISKTRENKMIGFGGIEKYY